MEPCSTVLLPTGWDDLTPSARQGAKCTAFLPTTADLSKGWATLLSVRPSPPFAVTRARTSHVLFLNYVFSTVFAAAGSRSFSIWETGLPVCQAKSSGLAAWALSYAWAVLPHGNNSGFSLWPLEKCSPPQRGRTCTGDEAAAPAL